ncbi:MAG: N-6 DNA methylase [Methylophaga sp.]|nr:N-6 DNA methylase [Methylophaga sp.]
MPLTGYLDKINQRYQTGISREHSYRGDLQTLLETLLTDVLVTNEPARIQCGAPDYILTKNDIPLGYIEAKDIGKPLDSKEYKEQFNRYKKSLDNLIITDYLTFEFYLEGELTTRIILADIVDGSLVAKPENFKHFSDLITDFAAHIGQNIKSPTKLSKMMAGKAKLLANIIEQSLNNDNENADDSTLKDQMEAFKAILIHDITNKQFADVYAQTIAYGMFAARLHDHTLPTFSRQEAAELIPKSNPFLRKLFQYIAGYDLDHRISWIIDSLADIFRATDVRSILQNFGKSTQQQDPIIHFYETFLAEYDPKLRKSRGVWYTPQPVVNFIVRAVDDILKTDFNLKDGLADTSKTTIELKSQQTDARTKTGYGMIEKEVHKVQILDPATGTGTFLAETIKHIHRSQFTDMAGAWSQYVEEDLIPRINGFEILMASYAMAHLKLELLLQETGYKPNKNPRLNIYLTNSLEESHPDTGTLFASWLAKEAEDANHIKRDTPVMVVMGNPPYSGHSSNKGKWIEGLLKAYKQEPGGGKLNEKNSKWLNDDYVKFIRYGQNFVEQNGEGVLAYINSHSFLDNPTFRGMRWHLLKTFDKIYIIDLHGNTKKKETCPDGSPDKNVFDIQQGVSINLFVKTGEKEADQLGQVLHYDLYGSREYKYQFLLDNNLESINFIELPNNSPQYFMVQKDFELEKVYNQNFHITELMPINVLGFQTHRDAFAIDWDKQSTESKALDLRNEDLDDALIYSKYEIKDNRDWKLHKARVEIKNDTGWKTNVIRCSYRPFDNRWCYFSYVSMDYPRRELLQNALNKDNVFLGVGRQGSVVGDMPWCLATISKYPVDANVFRRGGVNLFPLYLYPETNDQYELDKPSTRVPNLNADLIEKISKKLDLPFIAEKQENKGSFSPIDLIDYIYAILHSPNYRNTYKDFLKSDFPRVPYPKIDSFWQLVKLGGELRQLHLLDSELLSNSLATYPEAGDNVISRKITKDSLGYEPIDDQQGKVWINDEQYFDQVPLLAWEFYIGGYQPAQKWLKDRRDRTLNIDDIRHYLNIITALVETDRLMKEIDTVLGEVK